MRWLSNTSGKFDLVVVPLHGRDNLKGGLKEGEGFGSKILSYEMPADPHASWKTRRVHDRLHLTHNFDIVEWNKEPGRELLVAAREGVFYCSKEGRASLPKEREVWIARKLTPGPAGAGEVRAGKFASGSNFVATIEPMHGNKLLVYIPPAPGHSDSLWIGNVLDDSLKEGHALACGDLLGAGFDQIVVGWRAKNAEGKTGIKVFTPLDKEAKNWRPTVVDDNTMACEDLCLADLNGDGKLDIIASGRATKNLKIYFNTTAR
jgi:hypothetical protein